MSKMEFSGRSVPCQYNLFHYKLLIYNDFSYSNSAFQQAPKEQSYKIILKKVHFPPSTPSSKLDYHPVLSGFVPGAHIPALLAAGPLHQRYIPAFKQAWAGMYRWCGKNGIWSDGLLRFFISEYQIVTFSKSGILGIFCPDFVPGMRKATIFPPTF